MRNSPACHIEGYAIVSEDGMLANGAGIMPESLKFEADRVFFEHALDQVDLVVHGRHSNERQPHSPSRRRIIVTKRIESITADPTNEKALLWNPGGASFEQALVAVGMPNARVGIVGGSGVFGMFLDRYDMFSLSRAPNVWLPGGRPVFPGVPARTPESLLSDHGLQPGVQESLDPAIGLNRVPWRRVDRARPV
jgi:hypothetical protein